MNQFDHRVHIRDPKTGEIVQRNHYTRVVSREGEHYIRGGVRYHSDGSPVDVEKAVEVKAEQVVKKNDEPAVTEKPIPDRVIKSKAQSALDKLEA